MSENINGYALTREWFNWCFDNPEKVKPIHTALYLFIVDHANRMGWKEKFGFPSDYAMETLGIKNWRTYKSAFDDLVKFKAIKVIERSKNQYTANVIALVDNTIAPTKALDKATSKHLPKQSRSTVGINKLINLETNKPINGLDNLLPTIEFEEFWMIYPKHVARTVAMKQWNETVGRNGEEVLAKFKEAFKWQEKDPGCFGTEPQFQPRPQDYIVGERWNDENPNKPKATDTLTEW